MGVTGSERCPGNFSGIVGGRAWPANPLGPFNDIERSLLGGGGGGGLLFAIKVGDVVGDPGEVASILIRGLGDCGREGGGVKEIGNVFGNSFPANLCLMRCRAIAKPSLVRRLFLSRSDNVLYLNLLVSHSGQN